LGPRVTAPTALAVSAEKEGLTKTQKESWAGTNNGKVAGFKGDTPERKTKSPVQGKKFRGNRLGISRETANGRMVQQRACTLKRDQ